MGQYYLRARYYNPVIGRFTQEDTYYGDGLNLYAYCGNNPVGYEDPSGHQVCSTQKEVYSKYRKQGMSKKDAYEAMKKELGIERKSGYKDSGTSPGSGKKTSNSWWKPAEKKKDLWAKGKLKEHYDKHGSDFGAKSSAEYADMAYEFGTKKSDSIIQVKNGAYIYRYEPSTKTVFVGSIKGGKIKTFYKWDGRSDDAVIQLLKSLGKI
ncbi:MAG: hypothetical protein NC412_10955 [Roseburia sp.]|nr:hypothetical protein [Roseburia sp.]